MMKQENAENNFQFSDNILAKWQKLLNLLSQTFNIPTSLINRLDGEEISLLAINNTDTLYHFRNEKINKNPLYCKTVIESQKKLLVTSSTLNEQSPNHTKKDLETIAYLGYPIFLPNGNVFGSICVVDRKENSFSKEIENLIKHIKEIVELDIVTHLYFYTKGLRLEQKIEEQVKAIEKSKNKDRRIQNELRKEQNSTNKLNDQLKELHKNLFNSELTTHTLITKMNSAMVIFSAIWNEKGHIQDATYLDMNTANENMIGYRKEEILGKTIREVFPNTEQEWFLCFEQILAEDHPLKFELTHKSLGKQFVANAFNLGNNSFCVLYTEKKKDLPTPPKVEKIQDRYRSIFEGINSAVVVFDPVYNTENEVIDLRYSDMNPTNEKIMGFKLAELKGRTMLELFPKTKADFFQYFNQAQKGNRPISFEYYIDNMNKYYSSSVFPLQNQLVFTCYDISERILANKNLEESEQFHRAIFDNNGSIMLLIDPTNGAIINANNAALAYTGINKDSLLKMKISDLNTTDPNPIQKQFELIRKDKKTHSEFQHHTSTGEIRNIEVFASPIQKNNKQLQHIIINDITEQKQEHRKILSLSKAVEQAPISIIITNIDGMIEYANPSSCSLTGYNLDELIDQNPRILKSGEFSPQKYVTLWETISSGQNWDGEFYNRKKNGTYYWEQATIAPITDEKGQIINFIKIGKDITKQKELQEELREAKLKAEESDRLKTAFLANLSHEIRTPLNGILGFTDLLLDNDADITKKQSYGSIIRESGEQLMMIVGDLVKIAKIEAGQVSIRISSFSINELLNEIILFYQPEIVKKNLDLQVSIESCPEVTIRSDRKRIRQILDNLIKNAIKFTDKGHIQIKTKCEKNNLFFSVSDTGIGISKKDQNLIFDRFRQVEANASRNFGGNGLGLAISKEITLLMGGKLWVESEIGKGSCFSFIIPLDNIHQFKELKLK
jgi:PAS domain S-box-containing protein